MIQSMTGYGKATSQIGSKKITVEIKSLNSKGLDLSVRMPSTYKEVELSLRNQISQRLERGKIDFSLQIDQNTEDGSSKINIEIVKAYVNQLKTINPTADETELMKMAIRMPDVLKTDREEIDPNEWQIIQTIVNEGLQNIQNFRKDEGVALERELLLRIGNILSLMHEAATHDPERIATVKNRLRTTLEDLQLTIDENRFEQELIFYLEKYDITEEKVRLENHLNYFIETLAGNDANGRKLGFIAQEIGREINTMGSKSNHSTMQKIVVMMKDELEKIKEQVLNIL